MEQDFLTDADCNNLFAIDSLSGHHAARVSRLLARCHLDWTVEKHVDYDGRMVLLIGVDLETTMILDMQKNKVRISRMEHDTLKPASEAYDTVLEAAAAIIAADGGQTMLDRWGAPEVHSHRRGDLT